MDLAQLACFESASVHDIVGAFNASAISLGTGNPIGPDDGVNGLSFSPHVDGTVVPIQPSIAGARVPAIFGSSRFRLKLNLSCSTNFHPDSADGSLFAEVAFPDGPTTATAANYSAFLVTNFGAAGAALVNASFPLSLSAFQDSGVPAYAAIQTVYTYASYSCPTRRGLLGAAARGVPTYAYQFVHTPSCSWFPGENLSAADLAGLGPTHTAELPFVFGHTRNLPPPAGNCSFNAAEQALSQTMMAAWTAMAGTGSPSASYAPWPAWNASAGLGWIIDNTTTIGALDYSVCDLFDEINAARGGVNDTQLGASYKTS
jgi:hypothetical protein